MSKRVRHHYTIEARSIPLSSWLAARRRRVEDLVPGVAHRSFALGRAALLWFCRVMRWRPGDRFLLPAFVCNSIVRPFIAAGVTPEYYEVGPDLSVDIDDVEARLGGAVRGGLIIHYFGWPQPPRVRRWLAARDGRSGVWIEDLAHSLLTVVHENPLGTGADVTLSSFRKLIPCPDGALLSFQKPLVESGGTATGWRYRGHGLMRLGVMGLAGLGEGGSALSGGVRTGTELFHGVLKRWRSANPLGTGPMAPLSRYLIERFDAVAAAKGRRDNALKLASRFRCIPGVRTLFPDLETGVVPMALPAHVPRRDRVRSALAARGIEVQRLWPRPMGLEPGRFPDVDCLQEGLLSFPIAERYGAADMDAIADALEEVLAEERRTVAR